MEQRALEAGLMSGYQQGQGVAPASSLPTSPVTPALGSMGMGMGMGRRGDSSGDSCLSLSHIYSDLFCSAIQLSSHCISQQSTPAFLSVVAFVCSLPFHCGE